MAKFPLTEKMGLKIYWDEWDGKIVDLVKAEDLERALEKGTVVYGDSKNNEINFFWSTNHEKDYNTHKALLINVEEIPKEPLKHETVLNCHDGFTFNVPSMFKGKKVRLKIEEIRE